VLPRRRSYPLFDLRQHHPRQHNRIVDNRVGQLGVLFMPAGNPRTRLWNETRKRCLAVGMTLRQNGNGEGALSFDPANPEQAKAAILAVKVRRKRRLSESHRKL
jgi:hypothetical protein